MTTSVTSGPWFQVQDGAIVGESWGVPGLTASNTRTDARALGWFPGVVSGQDSTKSALAYDTTQTKTLLGDIVQVVVTYTAKSLTVVKAAVTAQIDAQQYTQLQPTDWAVVRKADVGTAIPAAIVTSRAAIRTVGDAAKAAVAAATTVDAVVAVLPVTWIAG